MCIVHYRWTISIPTAARNCTRYWRPYAIFPTRQAARCGLCGNIRITTKICEMLHKNCLTNGIPITMNYVQSSIMHGITQCRNACKYRLIRSALGRKVYAVFRRVRAQYWTMKVEYGFLRKENFHELLRSKNMDYQELVKALNIHHKKYTHLEKAKFAKLLSRHERHHRRRPASQ
jgi:hypothetical protein